LKRSQLPVALVAVFALSLLEPVSSTQAADPYPVLQSRSWVDAGWLNVVARLRNDYGGWVNYPNPTLILRDSDNNVIPLDGSSMGGSGTALDPVPPGAEFYVEVAAKLTPDYDHWEIGLTGSSGSGIGARRPGRGVSWSVGAAVFDSAGAWYPVTLHGISKADAARLRVLVALFGADGSLVNVRSDSVGNFPKAVPGGVETGVRFFDHFAGATRALVQVGTQQFYVTDPIISSWDGYFDDLDSHRTDIIWVANAQITKGCGGNQYCPAGVVTRAQMASFLVRALALPPTTNDYFSDDAGSTHEADINSVRAAGITAGCALAKYCPEATVTRAQMASFLARGFDLPAPVADHFTDDRGSIHEGDINRIADAGITTGCTPTTYCPETSVTRGQMASFLRRALTN